MAQPISHIYDKVFKKILTLSSKAVVNMINGLFDTDYPTDSIITYHWTEFQDNELRRTLADTILTLNDKDSYHIEAQMERDEDIVFRVFQYGFQHADRYKSKEHQIYTLKFPEPKIIYLYASGHIPDTYSLLLDFGSQGTFQYQVSTFKFLESTPDELNRKKLIILIPFQLLKLRKLLERDRSPDNLQALKNLINNDILSSIETNLSLQNISMDDARKLRRLTKQLYDHIYSHYSEMEELNEMTDESLMLDIDIIEKEHEKKMAAALAEKDAEIQALKEQIRQLQQKQ